MKKIFTYIAVFFATAMLGSCDWNDAEEAATLDGTWTGYISTYYNDRWGLTGNDYRTTMEFIRRDNYGGTGYEVDYDLNSPFKDYYYCPFTWKVDFGTIYIQYADSWGTTRIYDYRLTQNVFRGYMDDGTNRDIQFELYYDGNFNWNRYRNSYYYAPKATRGSAEKTDDTTNVIVRDGGAIASGAFAKAMEKTKQ